MAMWTSSAAIMTTPGAETAAEGEIVCVVEEETTAEEKLSSPFNTGVIGVGQMLVKDMLSSPFLGCSVLARS
jgi:hypothetical protein